MPGNAPEQGLLLYRVGCGLAENKLFFSMLFSIQRKGDCLQGGLESCLG